MKHTATRFFIFVILLIAFAHASQAEKHSIHSINTMELDDSAYARKTISFKAETALLQSKNVVTENSKKVMDAFLTDLCNASPGKSEYEDANLFILKPSKIKSIESYIDENGSKILLKSIALNEKGQPTLIKLYSMDGAESGATRFVYTNGMLTGIEYREDLKYTVKYNNYKMILFCNNADFAETTEVWIENQMLLSNIYFLMVDDADCYSNSFAEEKNENNCYVDYYNGKIWTRNCSSKIDVFPYVNEYTSYQDGEVLQHRKTRIVKKDEQTFEKYYSEEEKGEDYKLWGTFKLNEQKLVTTYTFTKGNTTKVLKIDYTYYP